jgi:hypothetical protein
VPALPGDLQAWGWMTRGHHTLHLGPRVRIDDARIMELAEKTLVDPGSANRYSLGGQDKKIRE